MKEGSFVSNGYLKAGGSGDKRITAQFSYHGVTDSAAYPMMPGGAGKYFQLRKAQLPTFCRFIGLILSTDIC